MHGMGVVDAVAAAPVRRGRQLPVGRGRDIRNRPGPVRTWEAKNRTTARRPANQVTNGGISSSTSSRSSCWRAVPSSVSKAATYRSSSARRSGSAGSASSSSAGATRASCARARCSALLTAAVVVPSRSATSAARHPSTSRRIRTARCRGGRYCNAATNANRTLPRNPTIVAGSASPPSSSAPGIGCSHGTSDGLVANGASGSSPGPPRPDGNGRR